MSNMVYLLCSLLNVTSRDNKYRLKYQFPQIVARVFKLEIIIYYYYYRIVNLKYIKY